jgi:hypothetical protein
MRDQMGQRPRNDMSDGRQAHHRGGPFVDPSHSTAPEHSAAELPGIAFALWAFEMIVLNHRNTPFDMGKTRCKLVSVKTLF